MVMYENIDMKELLKCKPLKFYGVHCTRRSLIFMEYTISNEKFFRGTKSNSHAITC